jgi:hypothetical protein
MAIFATGIQQVTSSVGTVASVIWDSDNTSTTTYGPLGSITAGDVLQDVMIQNTGSNTMYVGFGSISATSTNGFEIKAGGTLVYYGYKVTSTVSTATGDIWAQTGVVGQTTSCIVGLASIQNAVV